MLTLALKVPQRLLYDNVVLYCLYYTGNAPSPGYANDLGLLAEAVSWGDANTIQGVCGTYKLIHEVWMMYS